MEYGNTVIDETADDDELMDGTNQNKEHVWKNETKQSSHQHMLQLCNYGILFLRYL